MRGREERNTQIFMIFNAAIEEPGPIENHHCCLYYVCGHLRRRGEGGSGEGYMQSYQVVKIFRGPGLLLLLGVGFVITFLRKKKYSDNLAPPGLYL